MKPQHETFIREVIKHGNRIAAYQTAYPEAKGDALRSAAARLYNKPHVQQRINDIMLPARMQALAELEAGAKERIKEEVCSMQQRREALAKIILGKTQVKKHIRLKDTIHEVYDDPSPAAIIRAIDLDSKLAANIYKEQLPKPKPQVVTEVPKQQPVMQPSPNPKPPVTYSFPGDPEFEEAYRREIEHFKKMNPHLPADYLTQPVHPAEETVTENESEKTVTVCNHSPHPDEQLWQQYRALEPNFRFLTPEQLKQKETNFYHMKPAARHTLLRPLLATQIPAKHLKNTG